jgi:adenylate cyclase
MRSLLPRLPKRSMEAHRAQATATRVFACFGTSTVSETRKLAAILVADIVGYSRLAGADEDRILARLRTLRSDLIDPILAVHHGRVVKRTGDGAIVEFRSVVDAVRCAIEVQSGLAERNAGVPPEKRIEYRVGIHLGDVVEESDGDLMGDGVNIAARLEGVASPGAICLSEQAYWQVKGRLDLRVTDLGNTQLKNIAEPIHVYSLEVGQPAQAKPAPSATPADQANAVAFTPRISAALAAAIAALLLLAAAGEWYIFSGRAPKPAEAAHLSIVVLPFANLSGDPSQDYFADGVTESLTSELSRIRNSFVIARNTAFTFKGKSVDVKEIGKDLGVRYVLEGSVQRDQKRVRVNAQLIDAGTGAHLWADHFEGDVGDLFKLQDGMVANLTNTLQPALESAEEKKSAASQNPDAIDLTMKGRAIVFQPGQWQTARELFQQALDLDPNNSQALCWMGWSYLLEYNYSRKPSFDYETNIAGRADKAIATHPDDICGYNLKGQYLALSFRPTEAVHVADQGIALDPNSAYNYVTRAMADEYSAQFEQDKRDIEQAMRLSPHDPLLPWWRNLAADAELGLGHVDAARDLSRKAIEGGFKTWYSYTNLAASSALAGDLDEAKLALAQARQVNPQLSIKFLTERKPILKPAFDALRKAGLPEE